MESKDGSYIKNYVMSKAATIGDPGFLLLKLSEKTPLFSRRVLIPEDFFVNLEKSIALKGPAAQGKLYLAGKKFGYAYATLGGFVTIKDRQGEDFINYVNLVNKQIEGTFAQKIDCKVDINTKYCIYDLQNFVIIEKLGYGYFLPLGGAAGLLAYIFQDKTIEGVVEKSDPSKAYAQLIYAPESYLKQNGKEFFEASDMSGLDPTPEYLRFNQVRHLNYSDCSLKKLLDSNVFQFVNGSILNNGQRYFTLEDNGFYMLEKELKDYQKEIHDAAFETGSKILAGIKGPNLQAVTDYVSAFGWGDMLMLPKEGKYAINIDYFPYTKFYKDVNYQLFVGMLEGMLSYVLKRNITFNKIEKNVNNGYLNISLHE
ncbi:MAG: hypothetical protein KGH62_01275 [Candidatus Micrarchaeota archaeon]|nr:hypothetical protein [Candidatus Micrarchaeota archaeon]